MPEKEGVPLYPSQQKRAWHGGVSCSKVCFGHYLEFLLSQGSLGQSLVHHVGEGVIEQVPERASDCLFPLGCSYLARNNYVIM